MENHETLYLYVFKLRYNNLKKYHGDKSFVRRWLLLCVYDAMIRTDTIAIMHEVKQISCWLTYDDEHDQEHNGCDTVTLI